MTYPLMATLQPTLSPSRKARSLGRATEMAVLEHLTDRLPIQDLQLAERSKGINRGPLSVHTVHEMAERGELDQLVETVDVVCALTNGRKALLVCARQDGHIRPAAQSWSLLFELLSDKRRVGDG
jgi:hypothetical protein